MSVTVVILDDGARHPARAVPGTARRNPYFTIESPCPHGCRIREPLPVKPGGAMRHDHDTYYADAIALCCLRRVGSMEQRVETMFGIDEDEAVLNGRCRVYGTARVRP